MNLDEAPPIARSMAFASKSTGVGPMAAVAGAMAQFAGESGIKAGATEAIIENGGDIFIHTSKSVTIALYGGPCKIAHKLALAVQPENTPLSICFSSGKMGHSMSMGQCDLATVIAHNTALADAAATLAANQVKAVGDIDPVLERVMAIDGIDGVIIM